MSSPSVPGPGQGKRSDGGHPAYLLRCAAAAVRGALDREFERLDVTYPQFVVLVMLNAYPSASGAQLARLTLLTPQTLTVILGNLERRGLVCRQSSETNRRLVLYEFTSNGRDVLTRCKRIAARIEAQMLDGVSTADTTLVMRWLEGVVTRFQS